MHRRQILGAAGVVATSGCLRLQSDGEEAQTTDTGSVSLSEHWSIEPTFEYIWSDETRFYFNGWAWAGVANHGDGIRWKKQIATQGGDHSIAAADAFASDQRYLIFGFYPGSSVDEPITGHFVAFDRRNLGTELWTHIVPSENGENYPIGATIIDDVAILAVTHDAQTSDPWVGGVDVETGEELWRLDTSDYGQVSTTFVGNHSSEAYVGMFGVNPAPPGVQVLSHDDGSVIETQDNWAVGEIDEMSGGEIHGSTLFAITPDKNGVRAYGLDDAGTEWEIDLASDSNANISTTLYVDTGLVVVGTTSGELYSLERNSGLTRWSVSLINEVASISASDTNVWATNTDGGVFAYERSTGEQTHRSVKPTDGTDIAVVDNVIAFGDGLAYEIN